MTLLSSLKTGLTVAAVAATVAIGGAAAPAQAASITFGFGGFPGNFIVLPQLFENIGDAGLRNRIGCRRGAVASDNLAPALAKPDQVCRKSIKSGLGARGIQERTRQFRAVCAPA